MVSKLEYFDWLKAVGKLDYYEAALDVSVNYTGSQELRFRADDSLIELNKEYQEYEKNFEKPQSKG